MQVLLSLGASVSKEALVPPQYLAAQAYCATLSAAIYAFLLRDCGPGASRAPQHVVLATNQAGASASPSCSLSVMTIKICELSYTHIYN